MLFPDRPFIVMEELPNGTLEKNFPKYIRNLQKVDIILKIAKALKHMHEVCLPNYIVMHRDLKPKNIAINREGVPKVRSGESDARSEATQRCVLYPLSSSLSLSRPRR